MFGINSLCILKGNEFLFQKSALSMTTRIQAVIQMTMEQRERSLIWVIIGINLYEPVFTDKYKNTCIKKYVPL